MRGLARTNMALSGIAALTLSFCLASPVHAEGVQIATNGTVELSYEVFGDADGKPLIMIEGLAAGVRPDGDALTDALIFEGFRVIRFDSRDAGQSTVLTEAGPPPSTDAIIGALMAGEEPVVSYTLSDMADDTLAVLGAGERRPEIVR